MRASEWQFLCAVHESPKSCCAIDYCCHTLDWATNIVTSQKIFPSRLSLGAGDAVDERGAGVKHLTNIFRRLHRIFAHAWFQHRGVFWQVEGQTGLYVLFKTVCDTYDLLPAENYKLPPEAEGLEPVEEPRLAVPSIMKSSPANDRGGVEEDFISVGRTNTRRHIRQSPSVGSAVTTVLESDEEEVDVAQKLKGMRITEEERETDIPVIVETYEVGLESEAPNEGLEQSNHLYQETTSQGPTDSDVKTELEATEHEPEVQARIKSLHELSEGLSDYLKHNPSPDPAANEMEALAEETKTEAETPKEPVEEEQKSNKNMLSFDPEIKTHHPEPEETPKDDAKQEAEAEQEAELEKGEEEP
jgi:hypothetical protein